VTACPTFCSIIYILQEVKAIFIGYARTSTTEQQAGFEDQQAQLAATGCTKIFKEQISSVASRDELEAALDFVRDGGLIALRAQRGISWRSSTGWMQRVLLCAFSILADRRLIAKAQQGV
jgi:hypothetical protein